MAHPLFIMSAPKAHYPLFNLVERAAYPGGRQPSPTPSWSPSRKKSGSERRCKTRHPSPYAGRQGRRSVSAGRARGEEQAVSGGAWLPEEEEEVEDEEEHDDNGDDDDAAVYALPSTVAELEEELSEISSMICEEKMDDGLVDDHDPLVAGMADIDMNRLCFDDDIGRNSRFLGGAHAVGKVAAAGAPAGASPSTRSALAKTAAEIMVALVKTEEEIRKLEQIAMVEGARLSRQGSLRRGWADSPTGTAGGSGDDAGFCTPDDADELEGAMVEFEEVENGGGGSLQLGGMTTASLAQLIHQERMVSAVASGGRKVHLRSSSISEVEGETTAAVLGRSDSLRRVRPPCYAFDDGDVMAAGGGGRRRFSGDFVSEKEKGMLRASGKVQQQQQLQQQARRRPSPPHVSTTTASSSGRVSRRSSAGTSPCRPCFTPDDSRSPRLFSIEKLNAEFAAASSSCHARPVAAVKDRRRKLGAAADVRAAGTVNSRQQEQTASAVCGGCKCGQDNSSSSRKPVAARLVQQQQHGRKGGGGSGNSHISVLPSSRSLREDTSSSSSSSSSTGGSSRASFFSDRDRDRLQGMSAAGVYKGTGSGRRLSLPARPGGLHHHGTSSAAESPRTDGSSSRGSFKDSPFRPGSSPRRGPATWGSDKPLHPPSSAAATAAAAGVGSDSPFRAAGSGERDTNHSSKAEPLQVKLAAPQSPLRFELSPSRFSAGSSSPRGGRFPSGSASPLRARLHKSRVKLRLLSPFQLLRRLKEVCARLIIAASSSVKPVGDPATVAVHFAAAPPGTSSSRPSTSSNCSFVSASAATPARNSSSSSSAPAPASGGGAATPARISHRRSYAGRLSRGSPNLCSPAVSRHSFYCEAISDCIEFIKRSSTADTTIL